MTIVWLPAPLLHEMAVTAEEWEPLEAGGVLAGYWSSKHSEGVITHVVHAGPRAEHRKSGMTPDAAFQQRELDRIFVETDGVSYYLGDWHSHPGLGAVPSPTDRATLRRIASDPAAMTARPLMLILNNPNDQWGVIGWQAHFGLLGRFGLMHTDPAELRVG